MQDILDKTYQHDWKSKLDTSAVIGTMAGTAIISFVIGAKYDSHVIFHFAAIAAAYSMCIIEVMDGTYLPTLHDSASKWLQHVAIGSIISAMAASILSLIGSYAAWGVIELFNIRMRQENLELITGVAAILFCLAPAIYAVRSHNKRPIFEDS